MQCTAILCRTPQHTATFCNTLQHTATHCNTLQHTATFGRTCATATHCNTPQYTEKHCNTTRKTLQLQKHCNNKSTVKSCKQKRSHRCACDPYSCKTLQHTATLQNNTAKHRKTPQHTATHCNTSHRCACDPYLSFSFSHALVLLLSWALSLIACVPHTHQHHDTHTKGTGNFCSPKHTATQCTATYCSTLQHTATNTHQHFDMKTKAFAHARV